MKRLQGLYLLDHAAWNLIYGSDVGRAIDQYVDFVGPPQTSEMITRNAAMLRTIDVVFSGWGAPVFDDDFLDAAPNLKAIFYGAGSVAYCMSDAVWQRGVPITTASAANAMPVAEYTLATILFSLKHGWRLARETRKQRLFVERNSVPGCYQSVVGIVSLGVIGRRVLELLAPFDLKVLVHDPFLDSGEADELGVQAVTLSEIFRQSNVVSLHAPLLAETEGMITGEHLALMPQNSTFINTARGPIVRQAELIDVARRRPDLQFVLDVCDPEPPPPDCPLFELDNVVLTPHIAGSAGAECRRLGHCMAQELERFVSGKPLKFRLTRESLEFTSHRPIVGVPKLSIGQREEVGSGVTDAAR